MYYKNLYIRDFGIFNNQNLNDISQNLVVIGGKNRAGKSTFLKLLRYLPYGLPQNNSIPPARNQYYIEAELEKENKNYSLFLNGYSNPEVIDEEQNQHTAAELFNHLDQLSYQQLFSISLDELQNLSKIAEGKKKEKRLYSILLGAGFSELVKVPELADKYYNNARNIGGILGDPSVSSFKPYYNEIKEAEEMRDQALLEIDEFINKREELKQSQKNLDFKKDKINDLENRYFLMDLLINNYSELENLEKMEIKLEKSTADSINQSSNKLEESQSPKDRLNKFLSFIKSQRKNIKNYQQKKDLLKEKIKDYQFQKNKLTNNFQTLISELENLNSNWDYPLEQLEKINTDLIQEQQINKELKEYEHLNSEISKIETELNNLKTEIEENSSQLAELNYQKPTAVLKRSYLILTLSFLTLGSSFFIELSQLRYLSLILALAAFIYYSSNYKSSKMEKEKESKLKEEIKTKKNDLNNLEMNYRKKQEELSKIKKSLNNYAQILGVADNNYFTFLDSYFREIRDKKRRYKDLKIEEKENKEKKKDLKIELENIKKLLIKADKYSSLEFISTSKQKLLENFQSIFNDFNLLSDLLNLSDDYLSQKAQLDHTLKSSDKIKNALDIKNNEKDYYHSFNKLYKSFSSSAAVENEKSKLADELNVLRQEKSETEEKITTLKNRINDLSTSDKIKKAQQKINQAQNHLEKKAQNYAVNRSVNFILKKLRSRMIEKTEKELLEPASNILSRITNQYYTNLQTKEDLDKSDFRITTNSGHEVNSVNQLSRGSLEQLFLAVRISRIKEIKPPLPIILDDSLVNFDSSHLHNTAEVLANLASEHQIFILSCHPHLVSYISDISDSAQYWKLESGKFEQSNPDQLITHLSY